MDTMGPFFPNEGVLTGIYSQVSPNPEVAEVDACAKQIRESEIDFLVALGGGSALDCAKAAQAANTPTS